MPNKFKNIFCYYLSSGTPQPQDMVFTFKNIFCYYLSEIRTAYEVSVANLKTSSVTIYRDTHMEQNGMMNI